MLRVTVLFIQQGVHGVFPRNAGTRQAHCPFRAVGKYNFHTVKYCRASNRVKWLKRGEKPIVSRIATLVIRELTGVS